MSSHRACPPNRRGAPPDSDLFVRCRPQGLETTNRRRNVRDGSPGRPPPAPRPPMGTFRADRCARQGSRRRGWPRNTPKPRRPVEVLHQTDRPAASARDSAASNCVARADHSRRSSAPRTCSGRRRTTVHMPAPTRFLVLLRRKGWHMLGSPRSHGRASLQGRHVESRSRPRRPSRRRW